MSYSLRCFRFRISGQEGDILIRALRLSIPDVIASILDRNRLIMMTICDFPESGYLLMRNVTRSQSLCRNNAVCCLIRGTLSRRDRLDSGSLGNDLVRL